MDQATLILLREETDKLLESRVLGRSQSYARLLEFLVDCSLEDRAPKELEIAMDVFDKGPNFDPGQDSMVRVYVHNLRQKLERYYAAGGSEQPHRLTIPRGEYRVALTVGPDETPEDAFEPAPTSPLVEAPRRPRSVAAAAALLFASMLLGVAIGFNSRPGVEPQPLSPYAEVARSPVWSPIFDDDLPVLIVVGDYYILGELGARGDVERLVRRFGINSAQDLNELLMYEPELQTRYMDLDLTYLPRGTAYALADVLRVLSAVEKRVRVVAMSELNIEQLKANHVLYVGYVSGLGKLEEFVLASSGLAVGTTYDELMKRDTREVYTSEAGIKPHHGNYRDYGFLSAFPGPNGNQFLIVAGVRDQGLMHTAYALSDQRLVESIQRERGDGGSDRPPSFEMLFEVTGLGRTHLDATLVHSAPLDYREIWGGLPRTN